MLGFVRQFVPYRGRPIGLDLGGSTLRMAQITGDAADYRLVHAEAIDVPAGAVAEGSDRSQFLIDSLKRALRTGKFLGRQVAVALPPSMVQVKHVRVGRGDGPEIATQAFEQAVASLGGDASDWLLRHAVAGDVSGESTPQQEAIVFATPRADLEQLIEDFTAARVELAGVQVQARIIATAFGEIHRRKADTEAVNLFIDLGATGTRAFVAAPINLKFVREVPIRIGEIHERVARALSLDPAAAAILRHSAATRLSGRSNELPAKDADTSDAIPRLLAATENEAMRLADELDMCRRYYEATFPASPVTKLIFVGGGAKDRALCAAVAKAMAIPAQIGDPLVRFNRAALPSLACVDRREAQPDWTIALGLSLCSQPAAVA